MSGSEAARGVSRDFLSSCGSDDEEPDRAGAQENPRDILWRAIEPMAKEKFRRAIADSTPSGP